MTDQQVTTPSYFLDLDRRRKATPATSSEWLTGSVTEVLAGGWLEVELPADAPSVVATGPSDGGITQVGAIVRVLRDSSGRVMQIASPTEVDTSADAAPLVSMGATGDMIASAMSDAADALAGLSKAAQDAAAAQSAANSAAQSATDALKAAENAGAPAVFAADAPAKPEDGQTWYALNADGQVTGVNEWVAASLSWVPRPILAGEVIVPGSVGSTLIADGAVTTPKVNTDDLWATFVKSKGVTTDMLTAGKATITGDAVVGTLTGNKLVAGDSASTATVGPLSSGLFGIDTGTTGSGRATLAVRSSGPYLQFKDGSGSETFYADGEGNLRMKDRVRGGTVALDNYLASWTYTKDMGNWYIRATNGQTNWEFFNETQYRVMSPTGRLKFEHRLIYGGKGDDGMMVAIFIQLGLYTSEPTGSDPTSGLYKSHGWSEFTAQTGAMMPSYTASEIIDVTPGQWYYARAFWSRSTTKNGYLKNTRYWSQVQPV